jgi:signal transduction histidine kinase
MAVMLVAQDVPLASHLRRVERDRQLTDLERDAFILAGQAASALRPADGGSATDVASEWRLEVLADTVAAHASTHDRGVVVADAAGKVVASSGTRQPQVGADMSGDADIVAALARDSAAGDADDVVSVAVPVLDGAEPIGAVRVSSPSSVIDDRADRRVRGLLWVAAISLGAAAVVAVFMSATVTGPLRRLRRSTERVAAGEFDTRVDDTEGPAEVRHLARSFNAMTERIARSVEQQRAFAGDASHQLRTPLTALRLQLERTSALIADDPTGALRNLTAAEDEIARLQRMIDGLLVLARSDGAGSEPIAVDVAEVVADRVAVWSPLAEEHGVQIASWVAGPAAALAAPGALDQILDNYLDNAIGVAPEGSSVEVVVDTETSPSDPSRRIAIHVLDRGPGLTEEQLDSAFRRFWRAPGSGDGGSGLGLAIVAHLAASSGGSASLARRPGGGVDAIVRLRPAAGR